MTRESLLPERFPFNRKGPEMMRPPRMCACGHKLNKEKNEVAFYTSGRWTCPKCIQADRDEVPDYDGPVVGE